MNLNFTISETMLSPRLSAKVDNLLGNLPTMKVEKVESYQKDGIWHTEDTGIIDGPFFEVAPYNVTSGDFKWQQPALIEKAKHVDGIPTVGIVITLLDQDENVLLVASNEPFAQSHGRLRPAIQTSWAKLKAVQDGKNNYDLALAALLSCVNLSHLDVKLSESATSGNRIGGGYVAYAKTIVTGPIDLAAINGAWFSLPEIKELMLNSKHLNNHALLVLGQMLAEQ